MLELQRVRVSYPSKPILSVDFKTVLYKSSLDFGNKMWNSLKFDPTAPIRLCRLSLLEEEVTRIEVLFLTPTPFKEFAVISNQPS